MNHAHTVSVRRTVEFARCSLTDFVEQAKAGAFREGSTTTWCLVADDGYASYNRASFGWVAAPVCFRIPKS